MEHRAEINRFAIFLFCLLVPLGSLAPTETSESKLTTAERQKSFTSDLETALPTIEDQARRLFGFYQKCVLGTLDSEPEKIWFEGKDMMEKKLSCLAFHANCCVLHDIRSILKTLASDMGDICQESPKQVITANLNQLNVTLSHGAAFYTCKGQELPQGPTLGLAEKRNYIWWFLERYQNITQASAEQYSG